MRIRERGNTLVMLNEKNQGIGELVFSKSEDTLTITRTFISPSYRKNGLAELLMMRAIEIAQTHNLKLSATCSYGVNYIEEHSDELKGFCCKVLNKE